MLMSSYCKRLNGQYFKNDVALLINTEVGMVIQILSGHCVMKTNEVYGRMTHVHTLAVRRK